MIHLLENYPVHYVGRGLLLINSVSGKREIENNLNRRARKIFGNSLNFPGNP